MSSLLRIETRLQATRDAQTTIAADWLWEEMTVAEWDAQVTGFDAKKAAVIVQEGVMLGRRATFDNSIEQLHDRTVLGLKLARVKWRTDAARKAILSTLSAEGKVRDVVEKEAQEFAAVWAEFDAAWAPDPLGTLAAFNTLLALCLTQENDYKKELTKWRDLAEEFNQYAKEAEDLCQAWYAAATAVFPAGTPQGDMIRGTIDTGTPTPEPEPLHIHAVEHVGNGDLRVTYAAGGGEHATTLTLQWKVEGVEPEFGHDTAVTQPEQTVPSGASAGETLRLRVRAANSAGTVYGNEALITI